jgi:aspartate--ammonia ligase
MFKPRLLRETAEIAFTEIKRFIESRLTDELSLRRVSAPLYLPSNSGLNDAGEVIRFRLPMTGEEMEIVRGLNRWLRTQLVRYDIAPGFGVYTIMNAIRPELVENATSSPHIGAWAWQQVVAPENVNPEYLAETGKTIYELLQYTEARIIQLLPHLTITLPEKIIVMQETELTETFPDSTIERCEYQYLHDHDNRAVMIIDSNLNGRIIIWNQIVGRPLTIADISISVKRPVRSIGGNIYRDQFAMQILHQETLLR